jgi:hypothetical protein
MAATILAREDELRPKLTGHFFICTGMPHVYKDLQGGGLQSVFGAVSIWKLGNLQEWSSGQPCNVRCL